MTGILSPSSEHPSSDYADDEDENDEDQEVASEGKEEQQKQDCPLWTVVCSTEEEWQQLAESFKKSKHKDEKMLYETLSVDFVPEIGKMIEAKVWLLALCCFLIRKDCLHVAMTSYLLIKDTDCTCIADYNDTSAWRDK